ncbi:vanadium-dependent haloperoxidase [Virgisporangium ochraceum]|uniref:Phosphoesterase PA-phosphatase related protein n=1 Tax=Virgisporangium ochraceum TaxID=65505 RepID=A0A8J3ZL63_9ACTN|nr:vanadium-dependent haloperoxidase [Virgisporangium ochraceum]GIJ65909.1 hypothetical protein Voc01_008260 [Virgisporangium ochraceum]
MTVSTDDPVLEWFDHTANAVDLSGAVSPPEASRIWAVTWLAARRAVRDIRRGRAAPAALVTAVQNVLETLVPAAAQPLAAAAAATLDRLGRDQLFARRAVARGIDAGRLAADDVLAERSDDGPHPAAWRPYLIASPAHVAPEPPPGPEHPDYARDLAEVRTLGSADSAARTPEQTEVARFWTQPSLATYTPAVRAALAALDAPILERVGLVAVLHVVTLDAQIIGYAAGERHPRWRPARALGGPARSVWTPLVQPEPGEPEFPCLHTTYAGAAEIVLTALAGHPATPLRVGGRSFTDWRQLTAECVEAGVWAGLHLRTSAEAGAALGRRVAFRCLSRWSGHSV